MSVIADTLLSLKYVFFKYLKLSGSVR